MFKKLRKALIALFLVCLAGTLYYFLSKPLYRRAIVQTAEEIREQIKEGEKKPVWQGMAVVTNVIDGDTLEMRTEQYPHVIVRLAGIDAPEIARTTGTIKDPGQPLAEESRDFLRKLLQDKAVTMSIVAVDSFKRPVVLLTDGEVIFNIAPVAAGMAEVYEEFLGVLPIKTQNLLKNAEWDAKEKSLGIWALRNYQRPAEYRVRHMQSARR